MAVPWTETDDRRWEREDGRATLTLRRTADGLWAVTLDVLLQAPDGPVYRRATLREESAALEQARTWREAFSRPDS